MTFDPSGWSLKWYKQMLNICGVEVTTVCTDKWMRGTVNSFYIGIISTLLATGLGTASTLAGIYRLINPPAQQPISISIPKG